jgi:hypothetical protein
VALGSLGGGVQAADDTDALEARVRALAERMERLEQRNQELEREVADWRRRGAVPAAQAGAVAGAPAGAAAPGGRGAPAQAAGVAPGEPASTLEARVRALEETQARTEQSLTTDRLSETEPELVTRLKALEAQTSSMQKQARQIEALEGVTVAGSLTAMAQHVGAGGSDTGDAQSRLGYRGDLSVTLPGGSFGSAEGSIFTHLRFGQGEGIGVRRAFASTNSTAFEVTGVVPDSDSSFAILAQAWYQLSVPLGDGLPAQARRHLYFNIGKIDPFVFFDQNAIADDETVRFTNNAFVHNPLLDAGGDVGADEYGFSPGMRVAYVDESDAGLKWRASVGAFGSGSAANFSGSPGRPFLIGQLEASPRLFQGLVGNYRLYAWRNPRATDFDEVETRHAGWGASIDQRVTDDLTLFGRFGQRTTGHGRFDRALTLGAELDGDAWRRAADGVGFALGWLGISDEFRRATAAGEVPDYTGTASSNVRLAELYYRYRFNDRVEITPDLQWLRHAGGDPRASTRTIVGLRARVGF